MRKILRFASSIAVFLAGATAVLLVLRINYTGPAEQPSADMDKAPAINPAQINYKEVDPVRTGFGQARAVAVGPDDRIYVSGDNAVRIFDASGRKAGEITHPSFRPGCMAVDRDRTLYVDVGGCIEVYGANNAGRNSWRAPADNAVLTSIAVAGNDVFAADAANRVVLRYDKSGALVNTIGKADQSKNVDGLVVPSLHLDVAVGADGLVRVANPGRLRIEIYTPEGDLMGFWGKQSMNLDGFCGCCNPTDFALLHDGRVVTSEKGIPRVKVYSQTGCFETVVAPPEAFPADLCPPDKCSAGRARDVAADSKGRVLVLDPSSNAVRIFVLKGTGDDTRSSEK